MKPDIQYLIATHSNFSDGLKETLEFIAGKQDNVFSFTAYTDKCPNFEKQIDYFVSNSTSKIIIITTDVFGGSVNNHVMRLMAEDSRIHLITGVNLPLLLTLITNIKGKNIDTEINQAIKEAKDGIIYCNEIKKSEKSLDEF